MKSKRLFIAIKIANTNQIQEIFRQVGLDLSKERIKWVNDKGLHVTLFFIGNKSVDAIPNLIHTLKIVAKQFSGFYLSLKGLGAFPSLDSPRILWIGIDSHQNLFDLQKEIHFKLEEISELDTYKYTPHVTIGRIKGGVKEPKNVALALAKWNEWEGEELFVKEFVLMESVLSDVGPKYEVLDTFHLNE